MKSSTSCSTHRTARRPMRIGGGNCAVSISTQTADRDNAVICITSRSVSSCVMPPPVCGAAPAGRLSVAGAS